MTASMLITVGQVAFREQTTWLFCHCIVVYSCWRWLIVYWEIGHHQMFPMDVIHEFPSIFDIIPMLIFIFSDFIAYFEPIFWYSYCYDMNIKNIRYYSWYDIHICRMKLKKNEYFCYKRTIFEINQLWINVSLTSFRKNVISIRKYVHLYFDGRSIFIW